MSEREIFEALLGKPSGERDSCLNSLCGSDAALMHRVEALLAAHDNAASYLSKPAVMDVTGAFTPGNKTDDQNASYQLGTVLGGRYKLLERIGEGGMGSVFMAEQMQPVQRKVAVKLIKPGMDTKTVVARFEAEHRPWH